LRNWKYWVMRKTNPARAKKMTMIEPLAAENRRLRNSETSSIGWRRRRSQAMNTAAAAAANVKPAMVAVPEVGGRRAVSMRMVVDLPAPFGPSRPTHLP